MTAVGEALTAHELIKVKLLQSCSLDKDDAAKQMASHHGALLVQRVGRTALLYRPNPEDDG